MTRLGKLLDFGQLLKPLAAISLPLGNFCKGVKIYHFSSEIITSDGFPCSPPAPPPDSTPCPSFGINQVVAAFIKSEENRIKTRKVERRVEAVWSDLAKNSHFGKCLKVLANFIRVYLVFGKISNYFGDFYLVIFRCYKLPNINKKSRQLVTLAGCEEISKGGRYI